MALWLALELPAFLASKGVARVPLTEYVDNLGPDGDELRVRMRKERARVVHFVVRLRNARQRGALYHGAF